MGNPAEVYKEMASIIARFATQDGDSPTAIEGLFLSCKSSPTQPLHVTQWPCFALVAQGGKSVTFGSQVLNYGVGDFLLVSLDLPVVSRVTVASPDVPNLGLGMAINSERLADLMSRINIPRPALASDGMRSVAVTAAPPELLDASLRLLRLLERPADVAAMAPLIEEEILYRLLTGPYGPRLMQIAMADSPSNRIARAITWLRENFDQLLRIEELAERVGMSVSSLHHHFKAVTAMSPMQYQKQVRLHEARRLMLVENLDAGTAGFRVGYQSPSQFSREYSRLYGRPPVRDVEGLRETAVAG